MGRGSVIVTLAILVLFSCEEGYITDCGQCYTDYPSQPTLRILFWNPDLTMQNAKVTLYEGAVDDSLVIRHYNIETAASSLSYNAILYKDYSATLEFIFEGQKYITTGAACPKVRYDETSCDEPCYYVYDNVIDLRLRYH
ncbi:MAG: hypothetical protein RB288_00405 [Bacteroidales bacterium]|jgi:hypothetical protein|nr:hypothetical protein [Bacteroidales bacterium]